MLTGPVDTPWVHMAVIRDPRGTVIASQHVPENAAT